MDDVDRAPTADSRQLARGGKCRANIAERRHFTECTSEDRLHKYLKELRKGMVPAYESRCEKGKCSSLTEGNLKENKTYRWTGTDHLSKTQTDDHWKRMMRIHGTATNGKVTEGNVSKWNEVDEPLLHHNTSMLHYSSGFEDVSHSDDIYELESSPSDDVYSGGNNTQFKTEDVTAPLTKCMEMMDQISEASSQEETKPDVGLTDNRKVSDITGATMPSRRVTKVKHNLYDNKDELEKESIYEELDVHDYPAYDDEERNRQDYRNQVKSLRSIADKIESLVNNKGQRSLNHSQKCLALSNRLRTQNEELMDLRRRVSKYEILKREMNDRIRELENQLKSSRARGGVGDVLLDSGMKASTDIGAAETLPPMILETNDLDTKTRAYIRILKSNLYASREYSLTASFQTDLYRALHELPEVVHCKDIVHYINECIISDSDVLHTRLRNSALRQGIMRIFVEGHLSPFTNRYPFPPEFEQKIVAEIEASKPLRRFSMAPSQTHDLQREKTGIVMNRLVLRSVFKYSHINNLYNYLFTALYWDEFRVVNILKDAIGDKFIDFQMAPIYKKHFRHPLMWAFGDACNSTQAYRYMKALNFDFAEFPVDPNDGENLWHRVVKGSAVKVAQSLRSYILYTDFLNRKDQRGETPLEITKGRIRKELLTLVVVDVATKGSELYKKNDFEAALRLYSDAIEKQIEALSIDRDAKDDLRDVNLGKLYYNKARSLIHLNRWTETVDACEQCVEHIPSYTNAYVTCIQAYEKLLDWENAAKMYCLMGENCGVVDDNKMETLQSQLGATMFQILGLPNSATPKEIRQAFNQLCKQWHPDKIGVEKMKSDLKRRSMNQFNRIYDARQKLLDDSTRDLEQKRPETKYKAPEPITEPEQKPSEDKSGRESSGIEPLKDHIYKLKGDSQNDSTVDVHLLQTAVDRLQQQIDEMHPIT
ncbi:hypothetical protein X943_003674 [Babesia divergens]|uniref:J domain-containing protein n=1 Tax=Babesia divergens TaxID=32595 RepID=A0AAD9G7R9_BABDI|nr:hypothetical protein X943_003674 [Babesia divergens]